MRSTALAEVAETEALLVMPSGVATTRGHSTRVTIRESLAVLDMAQFDVTALNMRTLNMALLNMTEAFSVDDAAMATFARRAAALSTATVTPTAATMTTVTLAAATVFPAAETSPEAGSASVMRRATTRLERVAIAQRHRTITSIAEVHRWSRCDCFGGGIDCFAATVRQRNRLLCSVDHNRVFLKTIKDAGFQRSTNGGQGHNQYEGKPLFHRANSQTCVVGVVSYRANTFCEAMVVETESTSRTRYVIRTGGRTCCCGNMGLDLVFSKCNRCFFSGLPNPQCPLTSPCRRVLLR